MRTAHSHTTLKKFTQRAWDDCISSQFSYSFVHSFMICIYCILATWHSHIICYAYRRVYVCPNESENSQSNGLITYNLTIVLRRIRFQCPIISILYWKKQIQIERCCAAGTHTRGESVCVCACARWQNYVDLHRLDRRRQTASRHPSADILTNCVLRVRRTCWT